MRNSTLIRLLAQLRFPGGPSNLLSAPPLHFDSCCIYISWFRSVIRLVSFLFIYLRFQQLYPELSESVHNLPATSKAAPGVAFRAIGVVPVRCAVRNIPFAASGAKFSRGDQP
jgi:hypothetical protein